MRFLLARLGQNVLVMFAVSVLTFALLMLAPGDVLSEARLDPRLSPETLRQIRAAYELDAPLTVRYGRFVAGALRGDLGFSMSYNMPVATLLAPRIRNTLLLSAVATVAAWLLSLALGVVAAARRGTTTDRVTGFLTAAIVATPEIVMAMLLLIVAVRTRVFPTGGMTSPTSENARGAARLADIAWHMTLPVTALTLAALPLLVRHVRAAVADALGSGFIAAARARGVPQSRILFGHALRAAANPLVSLGGLSIAGLLSGSLVVEVIMSWPGLGPLLVEAILARDTFVVVGAITASTLLLVVGNLLADITLYAIDPRIRSGR